jgi:hypothetical protein
MQHEFFDRSQKRNGMDPGYGRSGEDVRLRKNIKEDQRSKTGNCE